MYSKMTKSTLIYLDPQNAVATTVANAVLDCDTQMPQ